MKITFLGTGAAQGIPTPYCNCSTCMQARKFHGKNMRKRTSHIINDDLLVDMGPDLFSACAMHDVDLLNMKYTLITHSHLDHFFAQNLGMRTKGMRAQTELPHLTLIAPSSVMTLLNAYGSTDEGMELTRHPIHPFDRVELDKYTVKSIKAQHLQTVGDAVNYIIDDGERKILIASDTAIYEEEVWPHLENVNLDLVVMECTRSISTKSSSVHLNIRDMQFMLGKMKAIQAINENTIVYATHFSHQHCPPHEELSSALRQIGVQCAYDGLIVEI
ncbi:MBL fold metallo-hydrolase [Gracilibacillus timonensis]|uniref:MBL fold metallo-hydrolase n=1 Tax=Gracilibacillus timonensis TaxID=1816696 RepID=UPI0008269484|nr:MBL fold metallo-hydrolase [Gracilibacillus timonensis]